MQSLVESPKFTFTVGSFFLFLFFFLRAYFPTLRRGQPLVYLSMCLFVYFPPWPASVCPPGPVNLSASAQLVAPAVVVKGTLSITASELYFEVDEDEPGFRAIDPKVREPEPPPITPQIVTYRSHASVSPSSGKRCTLAAFKRWRTRFTLPCMRAPI